VAPITSTDKPVYSDVLSDAEPAAAAPTPAPVPEAASVAPLDYQLEPKPVSRRHYRRVLWLCGASWLARALAHLRLFGGSADPNDPSHFTIPYQFGTRKGSIDDWLRDDGIEMRGHEGEMGPQSSWNLPPP
jgi:hypothetical protein